MHVLVINSGSSSIKFRLYEMEQEILLVSGKVERIGESKSSSIFRSHNNFSEAVAHTDHSPIADHVTGLKQIATFLENSGTLNSIKLLHAIGHRVVHGGEIFQSPTLINKEVIEDAGLGGLLYRQSAIERFVSAGWRVSDPKPGPISRM